MDEWLQHVKDNWNTTSDSDWYKSLRTDEKIAKLAESPERAFHPEVWALLHKYYPNFHGKRILLPSSGDNHAAFAFALMGAEVTSSDISERQLENAAAVAEKLNLEINFVCDNTMELNNIESSSYDLVYTSNGTHSWIPDLNTMYKNIFRVLRKSGFSVMYDVHPFNRSFTGEPWTQPKIIKPYSDTFPSCHWRVSDLINAHTAAGLTVKEVAELPAVDASFWYTYDELVNIHTEEIKNINDWRHNPMAALPAWIAVAAEK